MSEACKKFQDQIAGYVDQEIDPAETSAVSRHLNDCPACAQDASGQKQVKQWVREHAQNVAAPEHLRARVGRNLDRHAAGFSFWNELREFFLLQPVPAFATAAVLMLFSGFITFYAMRGISDISSGRAQIVKGHLEGEIVCVDCILLDQAQVKYTHDATHRVGLRCKDGYIWSILQSEKGRELTQDLDMFHRHVRVEGHLFPRLLHVEVKEFSRI